MSATVAPDKRWPVYIGRLPDWLVQQLDEVAAAEERTRAAEIRKALTEHVARHLAEDVAG